MTSIHDEIAALEEELRIHWRTARRDGAKLQRQISKLKSTIPHPLDLRILDELARSPCTILELAEKIGVMKSCSTVESARGVVRCALRRLITAEKIRVAKHVKRTENRPQFYYELVRWVPGP